ncbi:hypothetical protein [Bacillus altitudinis]|uniref:hypothetical protein n=1 Tax=Bacillus altitudinis TaxID=293387 RepID=UPI0039BF7B04
MINVSEIQISFFSDIKWTNIVEQLKFNGFRHLTESIELILDGLYFRIEPFKRKTEVGPFGYRLYSNMKFDSIEIIFKRFLSVFNPNVNGISTTAKCEIEANMFHAMKNNKSLKLIDDRGCFLFNSVTINVNENNLIFQKRARNLKLTNAIREISLTMDAINPVKHDLFFYCQEIS